MLPANTRGILENLAAYSTLQRGLSAIAEHLVRF